MPRNPQLQRHANRANRLPPSRLPRTRKSLCAPITSTCSATALPKPFEDWSTAERQLLEESGKPKSAAGRKSSPSPRKQPLLLWNSPYLPNWQKAALIVRPLLFNEKTSRCEALFVV